MAATICLKVVWIRPSSDDRRQQLLLDDHQQPGDLAVQQQRLDDGVGAEQVLQGVGVGGVAGLDLLGLRQPELVEQQRLQLLGRAEVELVADRGVGLLGGQLHLVAQPVLQRLRGARRRRRCRSARSRPAPGPAAARRRAAALVAAAPLEVGVQRHGEVGDSARVQRGVRGAVGRRSSSKASCPSSAVLGPQLAAQVAQRQVGEVEHALAGQRQVGRQRRVGGEPARSKPPAASASIGPLLSCSAFGRRRPRATPRAPCRPSGVERREVHVAAARPAGDTPGQRASPVPRPQLPCTCSPTRTPAGKPPRKPGDLVRGRAPRRRPRSPGRPRARRPTASRRAARAAPGTAGRRRPCAPRRGPTARAAAQPANLERHVPHQLGQLPVADHRGDARAQVVADLALHLVDVVDQASDVAVLLDQLGRGLLPEPGDAGQVVRRVAAQGRELRVLRRGQAVLLLHRSRRHPAHVADAAGVVEHGDPLVDELEGVAVTGDDQHVHAVGGRLRGKGRQHVVGFVALGANHRDPQRVEHLADQ